MNHDLSSLVGMVVIHEQHGPGVITSVDGNFLRVEIGTQTRVKGSRTRTYATRWAVMVLSQEDTSMILQAPAEQILDSPIWHAAPSLGDLHYLMRMIRHLPSNYTIPTANPSQSQLVRAEMVEEHTRFLAAQKVHFTPDLASVIYQVVNCVDWQVGWAVLQGEEPFDLYLDRMKKFIGAMGRDAWSRYVLPQVLDDSGLRVATCIAVLGELLSASDPELELLDALDQVSFVIEQRVEGYRDIISGYQGVAAGRPRRNRRGPQPRG